MQAGCALKNKKIFKFLPNTNYWAVVYTVFYLLGSDQHFKSSAEEMQVYLKIYWQN